MLVRIAAVGNILDRQQDELGATVILRDAAGVEQHAAHAKPRNIEPDLEIVDLAFGGQHVFQQRVQLGNIPAAIRQFIDRAPDRIGIAGAEGLMERWIDRPDTEVARERHEWIADGFHDRLGIIARFGNARLRRFKIGNVDEGSDRTDDPVVPAAVRQDA